MDPSLETPGPMCYMQSAIDIMLPVCDMDLQDRLGWQRVQMSRLSAPDARHVARLFLT